MVEKIHTATSRGFTTIASIGLFVLGAILVFLAILFPKFLGKGNPQAFIGSGIAFADAPSCGDCGSDCGSDCGGDGGGSGDGGVGGGGGDSSCAS